MAEPNSDIPENILTINQQADKLTEQTLLRIGGDATLAAHLRLVHDSLDVIYSITKNLPNSNEENQLQLRFLGARLFNSGAAAIRLALSGYYQCSASISRDVFETDTLLEYFLSDSQRLVNWVRCSSDERRSWFGIKPMLDAINKSQPGMADERYGKYRLLCEFATHPTKDSPRLLAVDGLVNVGPFFNQPILTALLEELAFRLAAAADSFAKNFRDLPTAFLAASNGLGEKRKVWYQRFYKPRR